MPSRTSSSSSAVETSLDQLRGDRRWQLDAYFPFDPYALPVSKRWLEGDYNHWVEVDGPGGSGVSGGQAVGGAAEVSSEGDSSDESEEASESDEDDEAEAATATPASE